MGDAGKEWWRWAWRTPQAAAWASGHEVFVARRAQLEDDLAALELVDGLDLAEVLGVERDEQTRLIESVIRRLHAMVGGRLAIVKECREMENRLGLNPKGMADLRWTVVDDRPAEEGPAGGEGSKVTSMSDRRRRLTG